MNNDIDRHCNDLTQQRSREQLSALMDDALPEDQTRFLLRRLQHDAELAGCWERWRTVADTMRGIAPAQRLPADFSQRVAAALADDVPLSAVGRAAARGAHQRRRIGGVALAAVVAALAILALPQHERELDAGAALATADSAAASAPLPIPPPAQAAAAQSGVPAPAAPQAAEAAAALALVAARPVKQRAPVRVVAAVAAPAPAPLAEFAVVPQLETGARPWPRSVLPQYGNGALTVGFGDLPPRGGEGGVLAVPAAAYAPALRMPPTAKASSDGGELADSDGMHKAGAVAGSQP